MRRLLLPLMIGALLGSGQLSQGQEFHGRFDQVHDRVWVGPELWANPLEDWRIQDGKLECTSGGPNRNVHVLTRQLGKQAGTLTMSVRTGRLDRTQAKGSVGFRLGIQDEIDDYRARLIYGQGVNLGVTTAGVLFLGDQVNKKALDPQQLAQEIELRLAVEPGKNDYSSTLSVHEPGTGKMLGSLTAALAADRLYGNLALVQNHPGKSPPLTLPSPPGGEGRVRGGEGARFWFNDWKIAGTKVEAHPQRAFGPILWAMHTLSRGVLKMTAQMPPVGEKEENTVRLQILEEKAWKTLGEAKMDPAARTATFRVANWNDTRDVPYRLAYTMVGRDGARTESFYTGTVRKDPRQGDTVVMAAFTGNADFGFPNLEVVRNVRHHNPDILFFSGDQIYEYVGGYGIIRTPADRAILNYLRKWYLLGLAFGDLMRDRLCICIPDDHDVYQGNIWGNGGNPITLAEHERGGYVQPAAMVNAVHATQCSNLPDPFDPTPIQQGITTYYCDLVYGQVGFAIIADRMFKSGPKGTVATWAGRPDHLKDPKVDAATLDKPGLHLLGNRQEKFLRHWAADWKGANLKCVLSQTIFCNLANYHGAKQEYIIADLDSGGWPQSGRQRAWHEMRRGFALHVAGDQHLASIVHHGIEEPADAGYSFCVPSIANFYPRSWQPDKEGLPLKNRLGKLPNTGDYLDGFKNHIRVQAIANPQPPYRQGRLAALHDKASGYGLVRFNTKERTMTIECWKLLVNAANPGQDDQFPGWPKTIRLLDNYGRQPQGYLPKLQVAGPGDPVVQVIDEARDDVVYTLRIPGNRFRPMVFAPGKYTVKVGEPGTERMRILRGLQPTQKKEETLRVEFP